MLFVCDLYIYNYYRYFKSEKKNYMNFVKQSFFLFMAAIYLKNYLSIFIILSPFFQWYILIFLFTK